MTRTTSFERAPVIEIVAELRWLPPNVLQPQQGQIQISFGAPDSDAFLLNFSRRPEIATFTHAEKLVPSGFPLPLHQVVWRFRNPIDAGALLQVGPGIFSANALQPYKSWSVFRPTVESGVKALLATRSDQEKDQPMIGLSLRYINGFRAEIMDGKSPQAFIRDVLKFRAERPPSLAKLGAGEDAGSTSINLLIPVANTSKTINVQIGDGTMHEVGAAIDVPTVMLDVTVSETAPVAPTAIDIMSAFDTSRGIIHDAFLEMTADIHDRMKPRK